MKNNFDIKGYDTFDRAEANQRWVSFMYWIINNDYNGSISKAKANYKEIIKKMSNAKFNYFSGEVLENFERQLTRVVKVLLDIE